MRGPLPASDHPSAPSGHYRRGAVLGMTMAEAMILVTFALLLLLALWKVQNDGRDATLPALGGLTQPELAAAARLAETGQLEAAARLAAQGVDLADPASLRVVEDPALRRILDRAEALPPDARRALATLLETAGPEEIRLLLRVAQRDLGEALDTLRPAELEAAARLARADQLAAADRLVAEGRDLFAAEEVWRLLDRDELVRLLRGAEDLPETLQRDLADLIEVQDPAALAALLRLTSRAAVLEAAEMTDEEIEAALLLADADQLEPAADLVAQGADLPALDPASLALTQGIVALPDPARARLSGLLADPDALLAALEDGGEARLAGIGQRLAQAEADAQALVRALEDRLGATVSGLGGTIEADGSIVLPDTILFEQGSARLTDVMRGFLSEACEPWLQTLMEADAAVARAQIEGHASSEWRQDTTADEAYLNNLALSQARSQTVLDACLRLVSDGAVRAWAHAHLAAVGYSSARPVLVSGIEDQARSRRVVFSVGLDDSRLLDEVAGAVSPLPEAAAPSGR